MTQPLATPEELGSWLGRTIAADDARALLLLELATGLVAEELDQALDYVADDELEVLGHGSAVILLPELPVVEVSSVTETYPAGSPSSLVADYDWLLESGHDGRIGVLRRLPRGAVWPTDATITVVYSHGYGGAGAIPMPAGLKLIVLRVAARGMVNPAGNRQETIGRYSYTVDTAGVVLSAGDLEDLDRYRAGHRAGAR